MDDDEIPLPSDDDGPTTLGFELALLALGCTCFPTVTEGIASLEDDLPQAVVDQQVPVYRYAHARDCPRFGMTP